MKSKLTSGRLQYYLQHWTDELNWGRRIPGILSQKISIFFDLISNSKSGLFSPKTDRFCQRRTQFGCLPASDAVRSAIPLNNPSSQLRSNGRCEQIDQISFVLLFFSTLGAVIAVLWHHCPTKIGDERWSNIWNCFITIIIRDAGFSCNLYIALR